jgi:hypothetical protein
MPWDSSSKIQPEDTYSARGTSDRDSRHPSHRDSRDSQRMRIERLGIGQATTPAPQTHSRNDSGNAPSDYTNDHVSHPRKHDYDLHAMETSVPGTTVKDTKQPIPAPIVTVRSEYPTLTRSRQQQTVTCLVTVEVPEGKWMGSFDEAQHTPPVPPIPSDSGIGMSMHHRQQEPKPAPSTYTTSDILDEVTEELRIRVDNWHGLEFQRFGKLRLHGTVRVGKDRHSWQELECYLFGEMLICVKEKKNAQPPIVTESGRKLTRCTLKGSILIKKHLRQVHASPDDCILTLNLSVAELPTFHLHFAEREKLELWQRALRDLHSTEPSLRFNSDYEQDTSGTDDEYDSQRRPIRRVPSVASSYGGPKSATTAPTEYSMPKNVMDRRVPPSLHVPIDIVVVIPVSSSMQGLKITLLRDTLRFLVHNLGDRDRMGLVTFGSSGGGVPVVGMTTKTWNGWNKVLNSIRPVGQKSLRADVVDGANVAMDLLMQRKAENPISTILLISDSSTSELDGVDFVVQRAEAAK